MWVLMATGAPVSLPEYFLLVPDAAEPENRRSGSFSHRDAVSSGGRVGEESPGALSEGLVLEER